MSSHTHDTSHTIARAVGMALYLRNGDHIRCVCSRLYLPRQSPSSLPSNTTRDSDVTDVLTSQK